MADDEARSAIRALKASGLKTEPTFGRYFDLSGDPYLRLLELAKLDDDEFLCHFDDQREACPERNEGTNPPHDKCVQISGGCLALLDMTY